MKIPAFNEEKYFQNKMNRSSCVTLIKDSCNDAFSNYVSLYVNDGYELLEHREIGANLFSALKKGDTGVFINFHGATDELSIVTEEKTKYFDFKAEAGKSIVSPAITQIPLEDFGMSYVIRLSDGRFIIIDGGRGIEPEIVALYNALTKQSLRNKPVIAAWIMTHAHLDHYQAYAAFMDKYADSVVIERYMLTFPEYDDLEHYPTLVNKDPRVERDCSEYANIPIMHSWMKKSGAPVYSPFIGQRYVIGDAVLDILGGMEATIHASKNINTTSLVIRMELGGQVIIWGGDASFGAINLAEKYGDFLKADILQVPHHGFQSGPSAE
ncbi:MAG: MBL fold metallo-hydrolase, partial [Clostridia bacterium]|nr:MBL fold metallo-hydrolase [Clostridia bacterium]